MNLVKSGIKMEYRLSSKKLKHQVLSRLTTSCDWNDLNMFFTGSIFRPNYLFVS